MIRNKHKSESFKSAWTREVARLQKIGGKVPSLPGAGWLQGEAGYRELCVGMYKDLSGMNVVCGNPITTGPYLCPECLVLKNRIETEVEI